MLRELLNKFWDEDVWLPPNTTWEDITPGPDKAVVYADYRHLLYPIPLAFVLIALRHILEKYWFAPFGKSLGIKNTRSKKAPNNPKLEAAYIDCPKIKHKQICALAKQLDMSERQVERWWRLRRSQDKPSTLVKFCENAWRCTFYLYNFSYGMFILWDKEWLWDIDQCYIGYPHQGLSSDIWWYYMVSAAFYWSLTLSQFWDVRRKDFWQMFVHHIATIALLSFSWVCNLHRIGTLVLLLHDCADIFLEAAKAAKYANYQKLCDAIFTVFTVLWIITRLGIYPFYIIWSTSIRAPMLLPMFAAYYIFNSLLCLLLGLHMVWTWLILQVAYKAINAGKVVPIDCMICESCARQLRNAQRFHALIQAAFKRPLSEFQSTHQSQLGSTYQSQLGVSEGFSNITTKRALTHELLKKSTHITIIGTNKKRNFNERKRNLNTNTQMEGDIRSSSSDISDSSHSNHSTPNRINNKKDT